MQNHIVPVPIVSLRTQDGGEREYYITCRFPVMDRIYVALAPVDDVDGVVELYHEVDEDIQQIGSDMELDEVVAAYSSIQESERLSYLLQNQEVPHLVVTDPSGQEHALRCVSTFEFEDVLCVAAMPVHHGDVKDTVDTLQFFGLNETPIGDESVHWEPYDLPEDFLLRVQTHFMENLVLDVPEG